MLSQLASQLRERLLSWSSWSGRRGDAGRQEGPRRPCLVCLLLASPTRDPGSASLAHTSSPTPSACPPGPSCAIPLQGGVPALRGAYLPGVPPFPFLWAPKCPRDPPGRDVLRVHPGVRSGGSQPFPWHLGDGTWLHLIPLRVPSSTALPSLDSRQVLGWVGWQQTSWHAECKAERITSWLSESGQSLSPLPQWALRCGHTYPLANSGPQAKMRYL